jgi:hypothetical protein
VEIPKDDYERLLSAIKEMALPVYNPAEFINQQVKNALEKYEEWRQQKEARAEKATN